MSSPKRLARIAGLLYLTIAIFGGFAYGYVLASVYRAGDAAATAANVVANPGLVRSGVLADLLQATVFVFLAMTFYRLLKHVHQGVAGALVVLVAIATTIMCLSDLFQFAALRVATEGVYLAAFETASANAIIFLLLDLQHYCFLIAQIFFGLWLLPLGYLAYRSGMFPRGLGVLLAVGGSCYLVHMLVAFLVPDLNQQIHGALAIPPMIAELWMVGYLLVRGVRLPAESTLTANTGGTDRVLRTVAP